MKITIDLRVGSLHRIHITKRDIEKNIAGLDRAITGKLIAADPISLMETKSILEAIKKELPE